VYPPDFPLPGFVEVHSLKERLYLMQDILKFIDTYKTESISRVPLYTSIRNFVTHRVENFQTIRKRDIKFSYGNPHYTVNVNDINSVYNATNNNSHPNIDIVIKSDNGIPFSLRFSVDMEVTRFGKRLLRPKIPEITVTLRMGSISAIIFKHSREYGRYVVRRRQERIILSRLEFAAPRVGNWSQAETVNLVRLVSLLKQIDSPLSYCFNPSGRLATIPEVKHVVSKYHPDLLQFVEFCPE